MFWHASREGKYGVRAWWHFGHRGCIHTEISWWSHWCHLGVSSDDEGWTLHAALPPIAIWLVFDWCGLWLPQRLVDLTWETPPRQVWLPEGRTCDISFSNWTLQIVPWGKVMEWASKDPWWVHGVRIDFKNLLLGRERCDASVLQENIPVLVPMPEGVYAAVAKRERRTWKRPRWFASTRDSVWLEIPKGIPHAGKGENSWDCGDDGLFGIGGDTLEDAIGNAVKSVLRDRKRYGHASDAAVSEALKA